MMVLTEFPCAILLIVVGNIEGATKYGKCTQFGKFEKKPVLKGLEMYCKRGSFDFCLKFDCPPVDCLNPLTPTEGKCQYCEGTCSYGGQVYKVGDHFRCLDGYNRCGCGDNNIIFTTLVGTSPDSMCRPQKEGPLSAAAEV